MFLVAPKPPVAPLASFPQIVRDHQSMVFSIGWHFLRDRAAAEELAQDAFLQLHRNLDQIQTPAHLVNWLRRVMTQRCIDYSRRARVRPQVGLDSAPEPRAVQSERDPWLTSQLDRQIARLPDRFRMMVVLRFQEELEPAEIAETLGIPVGTVKSSLHRALALLRGRMEKMQGTKT